MQLRRHKDIIAIKNGQNAPIAFHARNLEVAEVSEEAWSSMAPTTFDNGFPMNMLASEKGVVPDALSALESWNLEHNPDSRSIDPAKKISQLTLNVTQICNLHCTYCAAGGDGTYGDPVTKVSIENTLPQIKFFIEKLGYGESFDITFLGGEPLLYPEVVGALAKYIKAECDILGVHSHFTVITNGTLINEKSLKVLTEIRSNIVISIDGPPEIHDLARPQKNGRGSGSLAIDGLDKLLGVKEKLGVITIHAVFSKTNPYVEIAYNFFKKLKVDRFEFTFDVTETDKAVNAKFMNGMAAIAQSAFEDGGELELRRIVIFDNYFKQLDSQTRKENHCGTGKSLLSIDSRNKIFACPLDVGTKSLQIGQDSLINQSLLEDLQSPLIEKNNCENCWARFLCGGGCLFAHKSATGNKHKKHVSYCERTRYLSGLSIIYFLKLRSQQEG